MTVEERFERLEHYTAGLNDMFQRQREEDRALWRETDKRIRELAEESAERSRRTDEQIRKLAEEAAERDRITDERFRQTDKRIDALISAIGEFMRQNAK